jgi:SAM-dependent methyltransferase
MRQETEDRIARHYARGDLEQTILDALVASGKDVDRLTPEDLSPVDEFHTGGREATIAFAEEAGFAAGQHLLDVGCGIGGSSRYFASERGCRVTGIDLTEDYVRTAETLSRRVGLDRQISYRQASAVALPFADATFDGAYMIHVGMNVEDKPALFAGVRRVLKQGGTFAVYDVMKVGDGELSYPVPWAASRETSFVTSVAEYRRGLVPQLQRPKPRGKPMPPHIARGNAARARVRVAVEHVFAAQKCRLGLIVRSVGLDRATTKLGLANLVTNMTRLAWLQSRPTPA